MPENELTSARPASPAQDSPRSERRFQRSAFIAARYIIVSSLAAGNLCSRDIISRQVSGRKGRERDTHTDREGGGKGQERMDLIPRCTI